MVGFGIHLASLTVEAHEAEQMKELNDIAFDDEMEEHVRLKEIISYLDLKDPMTAGERIERLEAYWEAAEAKDKMEEE